MTAQLSIFCCRRENLPRRSQCGFSIHKPEVIIINLIKIGHHHHTLKSIGTIRDELYAFHPQDQPRQPPSSFSPWCQYMPFAHHHYLHHLNHHQQSTWSPPPSPLVQISDGLTAGALRVHCMHSADRHYHHHLGHHHYCLLGADQRRFDSWRCESDNTTHSRLHTNPLPQVYFFLYSFL